MVTEGTQPPTTPATPEASSPIGDDEVSGADSVEEVEAYWRNRTSAKDRGHAAEVASLKAQLEAAVKAQAAREAAGAATAGASSDEAGQWKARAEDYEKRLAEQQRQFTTEFRKVKYPNAAEVLGDDIGGLSDEKVAALEAQFAVGTAKGRGTFVDPNAAPKNPPAPPQEETVETLQARLREQGEAWAREIRQQGSSSRAG